MQGTIFQFWLNEWICGKSISTPPWSIISASLQHGRVVPPLTLKKRPLFWRTQQIHQSGDEAQLSLALRNPVLRYGRSPISSLDCSPVSIDDASRKDPYLLLSRATKIQIIQIRQQPISLPTISSVSLNGFERSTSRVNLVRPFCEDKPFRTSSPSRRSGPIPPKISHEKPPKKPGFLRGASSSLLNRRLLLYTVHLFAIELISLPGIALSFATRAEAQLYTHLACIDLTCNLGFNFLWNPVFGTVWSQRV